VDWIKFGKGRDGKGRVSEVRGEICVDRLCLVGWKNCGNGKPMKWRYWVLRADFVRRDG